MNLYVLISLLACHFLADFSLTNGSMIAAKAKGWPAMPILAHAAVHATLMTACLLAWSTGLKWALLMGGFELLTHYAIDTTKGIITAHFPTFADYRNKAYWQLFGLDQLLHIIVVVIISQSV